MYISRVRALFLLLPLGIAATLGVTALAQPDDDAVLWSSPDFEVKVSDVKWYMNSPTNADGEYLWEPPQKVLRAITDLMTLKVLEVEADAAGVMSDEEKQWLADYRAAMAVVSRHINRQAAIMMDSVNWEQAAKEYFLAHRDDFTEPEARTIRTFLLRLDTRSEEEALALATSLAPKTMSEGEFRDVVLYNTEDQAAGDGLMENVSRGQTVKPFEDAVFALTRAGEISDPVLSEFGVHVVQLLAVTPQRLKTFEEVQEQLIEDVKLKRWQEYSDFLRAEPQRNPPSEVVEMRENIDALLQFANARHEESAGKRASQIRAAKNSASSE